MCSVSVAEITSPQLTQLTYDDFYSTFAPIHTLLNPTSKPTSVHQSKKPLKSAKKQSMIPAPAEEHR